MGNESDRPFDIKQVDEWLKEGHKPEDVKALLRQITKAVFERALQGELTEQLGYDKHDPAGNNSGNSRNGVTRKKLKGDFGEIELETPRDRNGEFEPKLVKKHQTRFTGFDDKVLSMYARGMSTRDIQAHLQEMYGVEVSPTLISDITDGVTEQAKAWQNRALEPFYAIVFLDALFVKVRHEGRVENRAVYSAIGINLEGRKEVLGLWTGASEGAKFWLGVLTDLRNRGVKDIYIACVDGLKGFPQAIESVFPLAQVQLLGRPGISLDSLLGETREGELPCPHQRNTIPGLRKEPRGRLSSLRNRCRPQVRGDGHQGAKYRSFSKFFVVPIWN